MVDRNCKCMSSHLKSIRRMGQRDPSTFSIYVYASTSWAHLKINELIFLIYMGYIVKKCIMDHLSLSYPLTNINIHVQYESNLIMSYNVWLFFLKESWWTCCIQGYQRISEDLGTGDTCTIKDQFVQCEKGTFFDGGGGGGFYDQNGPILLSGCILRPHRRTDICETRDK